MRLIVILLFSTCLHVSAAGYGQKVSLKETNAPLKKIFTSIHQQTGYEFFYGEELLTGSKPVPWGHKRHPNDFHGFFNNDPSRRSRFESISAV